MLPKRDSSGFSFYYPYWIRVPIRTGDQRGHSTLSLQPDPRRVRLRAPRGNHRGRSSFGRGELAYIKPVPCSPLCKIQGTIAYSQKPASFQSTDEVITCDDRQLVVVQSEQMMAKRTLSNQGGCLIV